MFKNYILFLHWQHLVWPNVITEFLFKEFHLKYMILKMPYNRIIVRGKFQYFHFKLRGISCQFILASGITKICKYDICFKYWNAERRPNCIQWLRNYDVHVISFSWIIQIELNMCWSEMYAHASGIPFCFQIKGILVDYLIGTAYIPQIRVVSLNFQQNLVVFL